MTCLLCIVTLTFGFFPELAGQALLNCDGESYRFTAADGAFQDFLVPDDPGVLKIRFSARGGDGGFARVVSGVPCSATGGGGALTSAIFNIGTEVGKVPPGSVIRMIPGGAGSSFERELDAAEANSFSLGAGGGGGSGFLVKFPDSDEWQLLMVAGGGGGGAILRAMDGNCEIEGNGASGRSVSSGGEVGFGGKGGRNGRGGRAGASFTELPSGGGGGVLTKGTGFGCPSDRDIGAGQAGMDAGGSGGYAGACTLIESGQISGGGFGLGGGGAGTINGGGGGGGYSGGGGGSFELFPELEVGGGGGGSSYIHEMAETPDLSDGANGLNPEDGYVAYQCITNVPPSAICKDADNPLVVAIGADGLAPFTAEDLDLASFDPEAGTLIYTASESQFSCDETGFNTVILTVTDEGDLYNSCEATVRVIDDLSPTINCPQPIEVSNDPGSCTAVVDYASLFTARDNCGVTTALSIPSGSEFPIGQTEVEISGVDPSGNESSCTFSIMVSDDEPPMANCRDLTIALDENGQAAITSDMIDDQSTDNCGIAELLLSVSEFDCNTVGENAVQLTVKDVHGNTSVCNTVVNVIDSRAPEAISTDLTLQLDAGGRAFITPEMVDGGSGDACGIANLQLDKLEFTCSDVGLNTVTLTVTDNNGNSSSTQAIIGVEDLILPVVKTRNITVQLDENGQAVITPAEVDDNSSDACGIQELKLDQLEFSCEDLGANVLNLSVTDQHGNTSQAPVTVTIVDLTAPIVECPDHLSMLCNDPSQPAFTGEPLITDNCGLFSVAFSDQDEALNCEDERMITRTWSASDPSGNSASCVQMISILKDAEVPVCNNCPENITVSCDAIPPVEELILTDNCDPAPNWEVQTVSTQTEEGICTDHNYAIIRTFTISDRCGNTFEHVQTITVVDEAAPTISCPDDITVLCDVPDPDATGYAVTSDNCDPDPALTFSDVLLEGDCSNFCVLQRTWTAMDACGNISDCVQIVTKTSAGLIEEALQLDVDGDGVADPLVLGYSLHTLTLSAETAECVVNFLPSALGPSIGLPNENLILDPASCDMGGIELNGEGKITNPLLEETILLEVNMRLNQGLGSTPLKEISCEERPNVMHFLGRNRNPKVRDLADLANKALSGVLGPLIMEDLRMTLACINQLSDLCGVQAALHGGIPITGSQQLKLKAEDQQFFQKVKLFPNPAWDVLNLDLSAVDFSTATLNIYNTAGHTLESRRLGNDSGSAQEFLLINYLPGLYWMEIRLDDGAVIRKRFVIVEP